MKLDFNQRVRALMQAAVEVVKIQKEVAARRKAAIKRDFDEEYENLY
nr:MAG TPA: hypothetical protein [Caudoviricetes sp.]